MWPSHIALPSQKLPSTPGNVAFLPTLNVHSTSCVAFSEHSICCYLLIFSCKAWSQCTTCSKPVLQPDRKTMIFLTVEESDAVPAHPQRKAQCSFLCPGSPRPPLPRRMGVCLFLPFPGGAPEDIPSSHTAFRGMAVCKSRVSRIYSFGKETDSHGYQVGRLQCPLRGTSTLLPMVRIRVHFLAQCEQPGCRR